MHELIDSAIAPDLAALDRSVRERDLAPDGDLIRCFGMLFAAHADVERWLAEQCPSDWVPPPQTGAIADDLIALGGAPRDFPAPPFEPAEATEWIGPAYALAHLHLGIRLMLAQAEPPLPGEARRFLVGGEMQAYSRRLSAALDEKFGGEIENAIAGARTLTAHFRACLTRFSEARLAVA